MHPCSSRFGIEANRSDRSQYCNRTCGVRPPWFQSQPTEPRLMSQSAAPSNVGASHLRVFTQALSDAIAHSLDFCSPRALLGTPSPSCSADAPVESNIMLSCRARCCSWWRTCGPRWACSSPVACARLGSSAPSPGEENNLPPIALLLPMRINHLAPPCDQSLSSSR
jgi:hypothetical protein